MVSSRILKNAGRRPAHPADRIGWGCFEGMERSSLVYRRSLGRSIYHTNDECTEKTHHGAHRVHRACKVDE